MNDPSSRLAPRRTVRHTAPRFALLALCALAPGLAAEAFAQGSQELVIRRDQGGGPGATALAVRDRRTLATPVVRQRNPELSPNHLAVEALDAAGTVVDRQYILDPRVVRSESGDQLGELSGQVLRRTTADLLLVIPDDVSIVSIRLLEPRWTGRAFVLDPLTVIPLR